MHIGDLDRVPVTEDLSQVGVEINNPAASASWCSSKIILFFYIQLPNSAILAGKLKKRVAT